MSDDQLVDFFNRDTLDLGADFLCHTELTDPDFPNRLFNWWKRHYGFASKSFLTKDIDLYSDFVERNRSLEHPAITWFDRNNNKMNASYEQIAQEVDALCSLWLTNSIEAGDSIAIFCKHPYRRLISLLTAFRLGLCPSVLDPTGRVAVVNALDVLECKHIHADHSLLGWIPDEFKGRILKLDSSIPSRRIESYNYSPNHIVLRVLDSFSIDSSSVIEISAQDLFLHAIRDAYGVFKLNKGTRLASLVSLQDGSSPYIELMTLICGASLIMLEEDSFPASCLQLLSEDIDVIGFKKKQLEHYIAAQKRQPRTTLWKRWFRNPIDAVSIAEWQDFSNQLCLNEIPHADLQWVSAAAGIGFGTVWSTDLFDFNVFPAPGQSTFLGDVGNPSTDSKSDFGRFSLIKQLDEKPVVFSTTFLLSKLESSYRFLGCYPSGRSGMAFPDALVCRALLRSQTWHTVIENPLANGSQFILLAFMDDRSIDEMDKCVRTEVGEFALPDQIEKIDLVPKFTKDGLVDNEWCKRLYFAGEFQRRTKLTVYQAISRIKMSTLSQITT